MCTVSWSTGSEGLSLCFNRDERKERTRALEPSRRIENGLSVVAPVDPVGGGTWISLNEKGLCVFLLNNYAAADRHASSPENPSSRGELPARFSGYSSRESALTALTEADLSNFRPFFIGFANMQGVEVYRWSGIFIERIRLDESFLTTSSYRTVEVETYRKARCRELLAGRSKLDEESRRRFHTETLHEDSAFNPLMLREDSRTHNICSIVVDQKEARLSFEEVIGDTRRLAKPVVQGFSLHEV